MLETSFAEFLYNRNISVSLFSIILYEDWVIFDATECEGCPRRTNHTSWLRIIDHKNCQCAILTMVFKIAK